MLKDKIIDIMQEQPWLILCLTTWVIAIILVIRSQWDQKKPSVGLPIIYLLSLSILHFFGALIYTFPWYTPLHPYLTQNSGLAYTAKGFTESTYGILGFTLGSIFLAPKLLKKFKLSLPEDLSIQPNPKLPKRLVYIGLFFFVFTPVLGKIPSFTALSTAGISLFIVGICLSCWKAWQLKDSRTFNTWLLITCSMPIITVLLLGFLGYGVGAASVVLVFIFNFYRPRKKIIIITLFTLLLGLSIFVTYGRDRGKIREKVWGGQSTQVRIEQVWQTFREFEIFDPFNQEHLEAIDNRLNQNALVGKAVDYLSFGSVNYARGETLLQATIAIVPRIFWHNKPVRAGSPEIVSRYTGQIFAQGTSVGVGQVLEFYINFGSIGVFTGFLLFGTIIRYIDIVSGKKLIQGNWMGFTSWVLPGLGMMQPGGSLVEVVASSSSAVVLVVVLNQFYQQKTVI